MDLRDWCRGLESAALDWVYPPHCPGCGTARPPATHESSSTSEARDLCDDCRADLWPRETPCCQTCGESFPPDSGDSFVCQTCTGRAFAFEFAVAPYRAKGVLRDLIHRFKYQRQLFLRPVLGELLTHVLAEPRLQAIPPGWSTVPVPLHPRRQREREFNQAEELCRELTKRRGLPFINALRRIRYTSTQTRYRRTERLANLRGAFAVRTSTIPKWRDQTVVLIDDVFTTGSTAHECARVLRSAGAKKVVVITLARG